MAGRFRKRQRSSSSQVVTTTKRRAVPMYKRMPSTRYSGIIYRFKQVAPEVTIAFGAAGAAVQLATYYMLNDLDQATQFAALFDRYRISKIKMTYRPAYNMAAIFSPTVLTTDGQYNYHVVDYDDATSLSDTALRQYDTCQVHSNNEKFSRTIYPRVAAAMYNGTFAAYGTGAKKQWIDVNSPSTQYYGTKFYAAPSGTGAAQPLYFVDNVYYLEFLSPR